MLILAAAAALVSAPQNVSPTQVGATMQARAFVRIVSAVTLRLGEGPLGGDAPPAKPSVIHTETGAYPAKLIEFQ